MTAARGASVAVDSGSNAATITASDVRRDTLSVLSLGGGLQSSGLCEMIVEGVLPPVDAVIFANTQGEMPATYRHVAYLRDRLATVGVPLHIVTAGSLERDVLGQADKKWSVTSLPVRIRTEDGELERVNNYHCSYDYKRRVVEQAVKRLCGPRGAWMQSSVTQWIGYSTDEGSRVKQPDSCRCGHRGIAHHGTDGACLTRVNRERPDPCKKGCTKFDPWQVNRFPLIEMGMRRGDVARWLTEHNLPEPPRSACWFCPNRGNGHWRVLKAEHPNLWQRAVAMDEAVRPPSHGIRGERFFHQSGVPLAEADLRTTVQKRAEDEGQDPLFADDEGASPYDCDAGVCFT